MPDYLRDLREVIRRGEGSELRRQVILRKLDRFALKLKRSGGVIDDPKKLCENLVGDPIEWIFRLCAARLLRGDYSDWTGWEYRNITSRAARDPRLPNKLWDGKPVESLAILGEQGIGDEIMFASAIPDTQRLVSDIVIECDPRLESVFQRSFGCRTKARPAVTDVGARFLERGRTEKAFIPIADLPPLFRSSRSSFPSSPFIVPSSECVEKWAHLKGRTGIAWRGRRGQFDPKDLGVDNPVCLQYEAWPYETEGMTVPEIDLRNDIEDLLGICANLEKVVTVPQTIVHLAGAIGTKVEVIVPPVHSGRVRDQLNYRYGLGGRMDWYGNVRVYTHINEYRC